MSDKRSGESSSFKKRPGESSSSSKKRPKSKSNDSASQSSSKEMVKQAPPKTELRTIQVAVVRPVPNPCATPMIPKPRRE